MAMVSRGLGQGASRQAVGDGAVGMDAVAMAGPGTAPSTRTPLGVTATTLAEATYPARGPFVSVGEIPASPSPSAPRTALRGALLACMAAASMVGAQAKDTRAKVQAPPVATQSINMAPDVDFKTEFLTETERRAMETVAPRSAYPGWDQAMSLQVDNGGKVPRIRPQEEVGGFVRRAIIEGTGGVSKGAIQIPESHGTLGIYSRDEGSVLDCYRHHPEVFSNMNPVIKRALDASLDHRWGGYQTQVAILMGPEFVVGSRWDDAMSKSFVTNLARGMAASPQGSAVRVMGRERAQALLSGGANPDNFALAMTFATAEGGLAKNLDKLITGLKAEGIGTMHMKMASMQIGIKQMGYGTLQKGRDLMRTGVVHAEGGPLAAPTRPHDVTLTMDHANYREGDIVKVYMNISKPWASDHAWVGLVPYNVQPGTELDQAHHPKVVCRPLKGALGAEITFRAPGPGVWDVRVIDPDRPYDAGESASFKVGSGEIPRDRVMWGHPPADVEVAHGHAIRDRLSAFLSRKDAPAAEAGKDVKADAKKDVKADVKVVPDASAKPTVAQDLKNRLSSFLGRKDTPAVDTKTEAAK